MRKSPLLILALFIAAQSFVSCDKGSKQNVLVEKLHSVIDTSHARVGVALIDLSSGDTLSVRGDETFITMSLYKFFQAVAVMKAEEEGRLRLTDSVMWAKTALEQNTHSPLRDAMQYDSVWYTIDDLLKATVQKSDNIGCDALFELIGGPLRVEEEMRKAGFTQTKVQSTEAEMYSNAENCRNNNTTPKETAAIFQKLWKGEWLQQEQTIYLKQLLYGTMNGERRLRGRLPANARVAHKTGTGWINESQAIDAINDAGVLQLPDGREVVLVILVAESHYSYEATEDIIAQLARIVWDHYTINSVKP